jgi:hypothetical protein
MDLDTGELTAEAQGFKGHICTTLTDKILEDALKTKIKERKLRPEYNAVAQGNRVTVQG